MEPANGVCVPSMLTYKQALKTIEEHTPLLKPAALPLNECLGLILKESIFAPQPFPGFDNSAVDGYAVSFGSSLKEGKRVTLPVKGEIQAGKLLGRALKPGEAVRIFTGAPVPKGTQAVVMQEHTERVNGSVRLLKVPKPHEHIRFRGDDFSKGKLLVKKGTPLGPAHLALLATVGYGKVSIYPRPRVAILATGSELLKPGEKPRGGKIHDSNSVLLESLVREAGGIPHVFPPAGDDPAEIHSAIRRGLASDLFAISGGVSVGAYDFVKEVLKKEGVKEIFWKVDIKPGKPLFFGKKDRTLVFGLPGNPVSVFVTFEEFVKPAILAMKGEKKKNVMQIRGRLTRGFRNGPRLHFVRVRCLRSKRGHTVHLLKGQGSHRVGTLASANALLQVEPHAVLKRNQPVLVKPI